MKYFSRDIQGSSYRFYGLGLLVSLTGIIGVWVFGSFPLAIAFFMMLWSNNMTQKGVRHEVSQLELHACLVVWAVLTVLAIIVYMW